MTKGKKNPIKFVFISKQTPGVRRNTMENNEAKCLCRACRGGKNASLVPLSLFPHSLLWLFPRASCWPVIEQHLYSTHLLVCLQQTVNRLQSDSLEAEGVWFIFFSSTTWSIFKGLFDLMKMNRRMNEWERGSSGWFPCTHISTDTQKTSSHKLNTIEIITYGASCILEISVDTL